MSILCQKIIGMPSRADPATEELVALKSETVTHCLRLFRDQKYRDEILELERAFDFIIERHGTEHGGETVISLFQMARALLIMGQSPVVSTAGLLHLHLPSELEEAGFSEVTRHLVHRKLLLEKFLNIPLEGTINRRVARYIARMTLLEEGDPRVWALEAADAVVTLNNEEPWTTYTSRSFHVLPRMLRLFGFDEIALEIENLALLRLNEGEYQRVSRTIDEANLMDRSEALEHLRDITSLLNVELQSTGIPHRVEYDVKSVASTKRKLARGDELTDAARFRYILKGDREQCKTVAEILIREMEKLGYSEDRRERKNYVQGISLGATYDVGPKENGYESIHLLFKGHEGNPISVQVRTEEMHRTAEVGSASHGRFKIADFFEASVTARADEIRESLVHRGVRYAILNGRIHPLRPHPPGSPAIIADAIFAAHPGRGLECPPVLGVTGLDINTGQPHQRRVPWDELIRNGDRVTIPERTSSREAVSTKALGRKVRTLAARTALVLASKGLLDTTSDALSGPEHEIRGEAALRSDKNAWIQETMNRMERILRQRGDWESGIKLEVHFSLERAAKKLGLDSVEELHTALGILPQRERDNIVKSVMETVRTSTVTIAYRTEDKYGDLWFMLNDNPGVLLATVGLLQKHRFGPVHLFMSPLAHNHVLLGTRVRGKSGQVDEEFLQILSTLRDVYQETSPPMSGRTTNVRIELHIRQLNFQALIALFETVRRFGGSILDARFPHPLEGRRAPSHISVSLPPGTKERFSHAITETAKAAGLSTPSIS